MVASRSVEGGGGGQPCGIEGGANRVEMGGGEPLRRGVEWPTVEDGGGPTVVWGFSLLILCISTKSPRMSNLSKTLLYIIIAQAILRNQ